MTLHTSGIRKVPKGSVLALWWDWAGGQRGHRGHLHKTRSRPILIDRPPLFPKRKSHILVDHELLG